MKNLLNVKLIKDFNDEYHASNNTVLQYLRITRKNILSIKEAQKLTKIIKFGQKKTGLSFKAENYLYKAIYDVFGLILTQKKYGKQQEYFMKKIRNVVICNFFVTFL